jgi:hypothetical protein
MVDGMNAARWAAHGKVLAALGGAAGIMIVAAGGAYAQDAPPDLGAAIAKGTPILEFRPRFEDVSQTGRLDGEAFTARTRLGWQTGRWYDLQATIEFEDVRQLGPENYDTGVNGKVAYAQVFDPDVTELNRLQVVWTPASNFTATLGRQRINLDDQRFIGGVAWRQDEQTFDAARFDADFGRLDITYAYVAHVNRIFAEAQDWDSDSHIANVSYAFAEPLKVTAFGYALDFIKPETPGVANQSNLTWGLKASGKAWIDSFRLDYAASWATQKEYGSSLLDYDLDYLSGEASLTWEEFAGRINYEEMEGNGARGFATPLATLHAFNGWSDAFIANGVKTTVDGLTDLNAAITWSPRWKWDYLFNLSFLARYHDFEAERTGVDLGTEWNLQATGAITPRLSWILKFADYDGPGVAPAPADRTKVWVGFEWKL